MKQYRHTSTATWLWTCGAPYLNTWLPRVSSAYYEGLHPICCISVQVCEWWWWWWTHRSILWNWSMMKFVVQLDIRKQGGWVLTLCGLLFGSFFTFFRFYRFHLHNKTRVALTNLGWNICKNRIKNWMFPDLVMISGSVCLLVSYWIHRSS